MRVKCLAQEHNTMTPARARTRTARSGDERTNHEATAPPKDKNDFEFHIVEVTIIVTVIMLLFFLFLLFLFSNLCLPTLAKALSSAHPVQWNQHAHLPHAYIQSSFHDNKQFDSKMEDELCIPLLYCL